MSEIDISKLDECLDIIKDGDWEFGDKTLSKAAKAELAALRSENERLKKAQQPLINAVLSWRQSWPDNGDVMRAELGRSDPIARLIRACDIYKAYGKDEEK